VCVLEKINYRKEREREREKAFNARAFQLLIIGFAGRLLVFLAHSHFLSPAPEINDETREYTCTVDELKSEMSRETQQMNK
jgi:hypothetical protein